MIIPGVFSTRYAKDLAIVRTKTQWAAALLGLVAVILLVQSIDSYWVGFISYLCITIIAVLGLHILTGLCGQISLGQSALIGVGAYTTAVLNGKLGVPALLCLPAAAILTGAIGCVFGAPALRVKGFYLAMSTLAAQFILVWVFTHWDGVTGGSNGLFVPGLNIAGIQLSSGKNFAYVALVLALLMTLGAKNIQRTKVGRAFIAIRDNDRAAEAGGVNLFRYKLLAFYIGCAYAGAAGWLWAYYLRNVNPEQFVLAEAMWLVGMLIVGGMGSTTGAIMGAVLIRFVDRLAEYLAVSLSVVLPSASQALSATGLILFGLVSAFFLIYEPRGLYHRWEILKAYWRVHPYSHR